MSLCKASNETKPYVFNNQIGKAYKGSTLIYNAEKIIYPPKSTLTWNTGGTSTECYVNDTQIFSRCNGTSQTLGYCYTTIDCTGWDTITFNVISVSRNGNANNSLVVDEPYGAYGAYKGLLNVGVGTHSFSIADLTGNHTFYIGVFGSTGSSTIAVNKIVLS